MAYLIPKNRLNMHIRMEECVNKDNPIRFIDDFVVKLELPQLGFVVPEVKIKGRQSFNPRIF